jgi:hypothetical protein
MPTNASGCTPSADPERAGRLFVAKRFRRQALTAPTAGRRSILVRMWPKRVGAKPVESISRRRCTLFCPSVSDSWRRLEA